MEFNFSLLIKNLSKIYFSLKSIVFDKKVRALEQRIITASIQTINNNLLKLSI